MQSCVFMSACIADIDTVHSCHEGRGANMRGIISLLKLKGDFRLIDTLKKGTVESLSSDND